VADAGLWFDIRQDAPFPLQVQASCAADEVLAIFGPSGSGKTTLLRSIAGLHTPAQATIRFGDEIWTDTAQSRWLSPQRRRVGVVFQDYALFPHLTARGNVMAALGDRPAASRAAAADRWLAAVHLERLEDRRPAELSGGQRQRVALARALAREPRVLLLDEPFSAVDRSTRRQLHRELDELRRRVLIPVLLVTHDFQDVARLATHVVVIERGRAIGGGPITALTSRPDVPWLDLVPDAGSVIDGRVESTDAARGIADVAFEGGTMIVPVGELRSGDAVRLRVPAREVILASGRPAGVSLHNILEGVVALLAAAGDRVLVQVAVGPSYLLAEVTRDAVQRLHLEPGARVYALIKSVSIDVGA
jgi:molybdate transport system ATP-binding protein